MIDVVSVLVEISYMSLTDIFTMESHIASCVLFGLEVHHEDNM